MRESLLIVFGVMFVALKLMGFINWSWIWVLSPFWVQVLVWFVYFAYLAAKRNRS
jgi:hypothetical protein